MSRTIETLTNAESFKLVGELLRGYGKVETHRNAVRNHFTGILMLDAGLRVSEVCSLKLYQCLFRQDPVESLVITTAKRKDHSTRTIPLTLRVKTAIEQMNTVFWRFGGFGPDSFCLAKYCAGKPITPRQIQRIIKAASNHAIGRAIHPHVLRHTFASNLMRKTSIRVVQELLGHSSITSTQVYTHPNHDDLDAAIKSLEVS